MNKKYVQGVLFLLVAIIPLKAMDQQQQRLTETTSLLHFSLEQKTNLKTPHVVLDIINSSVQDSIELEEQELLVSWWDKEVSCCGSKKFPRQCHVIACGGFVFLVGLSALCVWLDHHNND